MKLGTKEIADIQAKVLNDSKKGFGYFFKNVLLILLILIGAFIFTNPILIKNPESFVSTLHYSSIYTVGVLFLIIFGIYKLAASLNKQNKSEEAKNIANTVVSEQNGVNERREERHKEFMLQRIKSGVEISNQLKSLLINLGASRASVAEMHNGSHNINGCPFVRATVNYEEISPKVDYVADEFKNFNLLKYPFISEHFDDNLWLGSVDEIEKEDPLFASKLRCGDSKFVCMQVLNGRKIPFGFLCVSFSDASHPSKTQIISEISKAAQVISTLLDKEDE